MIDEHFAIVCAGANVGERRWTFTTPRSAGEGSYKKTRGSALWQAGARKENSALHFAKPVIGKFNSVLRFAKLEIGENNPAVHRDKGALRKNGATLRIATSAVRNSNLAPHSGQLPKKNLNSELRSAQSGIPSRGTRLSPRVHRFLDPELKIVQCGSEHRNAGFRLRRSSLNSPRAAQEICRSAPKSPASRGFLAAAFT